MKTRLKKINRYICDQLKIMYMKSGKIFLQMFILIK